MEIYRLFCEWRSSEKIEMDIVNLTEQSLVLKPLGSTTAAEIMAFEEHLKKQSSGELNCLKIQLNH